MKLEERELMKEYGFEEIPVFYKELKSGLSMLVAEVEDVGYHVRVRTENGDPFTDYLLTDLKEFAQFKDLEENN